MDQQAALILNVKAGSAGFPSAQCGLLLIQGEMKNVNEWSSEKT